MVNNETLPLDKRNTRLILVLGDAASYPVVAGGGSGAVHNDHILPPIWALCDEYDIPRSSFPLDTIISSDCNKDKTFCLFYLGFIRTTLSYGHDENIDLDKESMDKLDSIYKMQFDMTFIFGGVFSWEGGDRGSLAWRSDEVLYYLGRIENPGKTIGAITGPGPVLLRSLENEVDAMLFNVMPGQEYAKGLMNIIFGRANPSAKLSFTMPFVDNE